MLEKIANKSVLNNQNGQALLIIVLVMVVALTITLSVVSRAVVNLRTTQEQVDSQKALAAAEAGVEKQIQNINTGSIGEGTLSTSNSSFKTTVTSVDGAAPFLVNGGKTVKQDEGAYVWLSDYNQTPRFNTKWTGNLTINWNDSAALEVAVISGNDVASSKITRYVYDSQSRIPGAGSGITTPGDSGFNHKTTISITNGMLLRIIPLYSDTVVRVSSSQALPLQGKLIESTGCVPNCNSGSTQRKVTVFQGYPELPADFFPYSLLIP